MYSVLYLSFLGTLNIFVIRSTCATSKFILHGEYNVGGLFPIHRELKPTPRSSPVALECSKHPISKSGYQMFQLMRFAVEEINNSSILLPNVSLGYEIFDYCSDMQNFPAVLDFFATNRSLEVTGSLRLQPKVIAITGPSRSSETQTVAPFFVMDTLPMVNYAATSSALSNMWGYQSFLRTVSSNKDQIQLIFHIIRWFQWNWVAFINSPDEYGRNGFRLFYNNLHCSICLGYQAELKMTKNSEIFRQLHLLNVNVIVVFALRPHAKAFLRSAIHNKLHSKVWITSDSLSTETKFSMEHGLHGIGTIIGIAGKGVALPGFSEFISASQMGDEDDCVECATNSQRSSETICNQSCKNCTQVKLEDINTEKFQYAFSIYSAIYTIAHALHNVLQCGMGGCNKSKELHSSELLREMKMSNFTLMDRPVKYDETGDPPASYKIVLWNTVLRPPVLQIIGTYDTSQGIHFYINNSLIVWHGDGQVPFSNCSVECALGYARVAVGSHQCCFHCVKCTRNTYINFTRDPYACTDCPEGEWSDEGSTYCRRCSLEYLHFTEPVSISIMFSASLLMTLTIAVMILFLHNYQTPVVRSSGGSMCFLMLVCVILSAVSVFFYFGPPNASNCILRYLLYSNFGTLCISCLAVRSFQIVYIFKMASKFPRAYSWWVKHNGQWIFVAVCFVCQIILSVIWMVAGFVPKPCFDTTSLKGQIIWKCCTEELSLFLIPFLVGLLVGSLCVYLSYMSSDLPKNYNEGKSITFTLFVFFFSWAAYFTVVQIFKDKYSQICDTTVQQVTMYGILFNYFIPKSYIIIFQPQKNTQEYFQTAIQSYTQTNSRT